MIEDTKKPEGKKEILASEILNKIEDGEPVVYDRVVIKGNLNLKELNLPTKHINRIKRWKGRRMDIDLPEDLKIIKSIIKITNTDFNGQLDFSNASFEQTVEFYNSTFNELSDFNNTSFEQTAIFNSSIFKRNASFYNSTFNSDTYFFVATFESHADFSHSQFKGEADFEAAKFLGGSAGFKDSQFSERASFYKSEFKEDADFENSKFDEGANYNDSHFEGSAKFEKTRYIGDANFADIKFDGNAYFDDSKYKGEANYNKSQFRGAANFNRSQFRGMADFRRARFNSSANFEDSQFDLDTLFDEAIFCKELTLTRAKFQKFYIKYDHIKKALLFEDDVYQSLVESYKKLGWFEDADECYYNYRILHRINDPIKRSFDVAARFFYGYGVKPVRPMVWSAIIIIISGAIFFYSINDISPWGAIFVSANAFTSGANTLFNTSSSSIPSAGYLIYLVTLEKLLGWIFFALFLASIGRTIIR